MPRRKNQKIERIENSNYGYVIKDILSTFDTKPKNTIKAKSSVKFSFF